MSAGPALLDFTVAQLGWSRPIRLTATGIAAGWAVREPGVFSAEVVTSDLIAETGTVDLRGRWLRWDHPTLGRWSGVVTDTQPDSDSGATELAATDFRVLLDRRRTAKVYDIQSATAGGIARRLVTDASRLEPLWITEVRADETGPKIGYQARAGDVLAALGSLADAAGQEWRVDGDRVLEWRAKLGRNLRSTVQLVEGREIVSFRYPHALTPVVNDLLVVPANADYARTNSVVVRDSASIRQFGVRSDTVVVTDAVVEGMLRPRGLARMGQLAKLGRTLALAVTDDDDVWAAFREGDTMTALLSSINTRIAARVMTRAWDSDGVVLNLMCDVEAT